MFWPVRTRLVVMIHLSRLQSSRACQCMCVKGMLRHRSRACLGSGKRTRLWCSCIVACVLHSMRGEHGCAAAGGRAVPGARAQAAAPVRVQPPHAPAAAGPAALSRCARQGPMSRCMCAVQQRLLLAGSVPSMPTLPRILSKARSHQSCPTASVSMQPRLHHALVSPAKCMCSMQAAVTRSQAARAC